MVEDLYKARHSGTAMEGFGTIFDVGHVSGPILGGLLVGALAMDGLSHSCLHPDRHDPVIPERHGREVIPKFHNPKFFI